MDLARSRAWRVVRITLLMYVLVMVALGSWLTRSRATSWEDTLWVTIYPLNGDGSKTAGNYIASLTRDHFLPVVEFFESEGEHYDLGLTVPVRVDLGAEIKEHPPTPPMSRNPITIAWWSLRLRYWVWALAGDAGPSDVDIFVKYFDPATNHRLAHSLGLQKGMIGVVNAFADPAYTGSNQVIITHELLHTVGASDLYDFATGQPIYPIGFAEPDLKPLYPQRFAEIMAGRVPSSASTSNVPVSLHQTQIGEHTAIEIRWLR